MASKEKHPKPLVRVTKKFILKTQTPTQPNRMPAGTIQEIFLSQFQIVDILVAHLSPHSNTSNCAADTRNSVITAVKLCLAGGVDIFGPDFALKDLVRRGNRSYVKVKLGNTGPGSYKPEVYGPVIGLLMCIERRGVTSYILTTSKEKLVSDDKAAVQEMLAHLKINMLSPELFIESKIVKLFFDAEDNAALFRIFAKVTGIEAALADDFGYNSDLLGEDAENVLGGIQKTVTKAQMQTELLHTQQYSQMRIQNIEKELAWMKAYTLQMKIPGVKRRLEDVTKAMKEARKEKVETLFYVLEARKICRENEVAMQKCLAMYTPDSEHYLRLVKKSWPGLVHILKQGRHLKHEVPEMPQVTPTELHTMYRNLLSMISESVRSAEAEQRRIETKLAILETQSHVLQSELNKLTLQSRTFEKQAGDWTPSKSPFPPRTPFQAQRELQECQEYVKGIAKLQETSDVERMVELKTKYSDVWHILTDIYGSIEGTREIHPAARKKNTHGNMSFLMDIMNIVNRPFYIVDMDTSLSAAERLTVTGILKQYAAEKPVQILILQPGRNTD